MVADRKLVAVGALKGPHGLKGMVKGDIRLDDVNLVMKAGPLLTEDGREFKVTKVQGAGQGMVALQIAGIETVEAAEPLKGIRVFLDRANWPEPEGEVYLEDLVGREVVDASGKVVGVVESVLELPAGPALSVEGRLVPCAEEFMSVGEQVVLTELGTAVFAV